MPPGFAASRHWPHRVFLAVAHAWVGGGAARECVGFGLTASAAVAMLLPRRRRGVDVVAVVSRAESNGVWRSEQPAKLKLCGAHKRRPPAYPASRGGTPSCTPAGGRRGEGRQGPKCVFCRRCARSRELGRRAAACKGQSGIPAFSTVLLSSHSDRQYVLLREDLCGRPTLAHNGG